ncbi:putative NAD dependent epimerase/dehydratase [Paramyrothecium foliicola]|nr:putative NAD dependent epimerase/dehydratase [Paramyrothecium foliicola]
MTRHALIIGGNGEIARILIPLLLEKSWTVASVRTPDQVASNKALAGPHPGKLNVRVESVGEIYDTSKAKKLLEDVKPDSVVWAAGAAGKGDADQLMGVSTRDTLQEVLTQKQTYRVERDAARFVLDAAVQSTFIHKFIVTSWIANRRSRPVWWDEKGWADTLGMHKLLPDYYQAKAIKLRNDFVGISLRHGILSEAPAGPVELGKTSSPSGDIIRAPVAKVTSALLDSNRVHSSWIDLLDGEEDIRTAIDRVAEGHVNSAEGEERVELVLDELLVDII